VGEGGLAQGSGTNHIVLQRGALLAEVHRHGAITRGVIPTYTAIEAFRFMIKLGSLEPHIL
jgi:hypothetical protein